MSDIRMQFLDLAIHRGVLKFGQFQLKSGRISPYFFNAGLFDLGSDLAKLGSYYARAIVESGIQFDMLFGPAYKGIPLASVTAAALYNEHQLDIPYAFNRKEAKDHGEGGNIVGRALEGRVLIIDDVITAGTAISESVETIRAADAQPAGVVIALDRQEKGQGSLSAVQEAEKNHALPVISIASVNDLKNYLQDQQETEKISSMEAYLKEHGI